MIKPFYKRFTDKHPDFAHQSYTAWSFGADPDALALLVIKGIKRATASLHKLYVYENEPLPQVGDISVVLFENGEPACIIKTTCVKVIPFNDISEAFAYQEGEGDRSLGYWKAVHRQFFEQELKPYNESFDPTMNVVCETFVCLYNESENRHD